MLWDCVKNKSIKFDDFKISLSKLYNISLRILPTRRLLFSKSKIACSKMCFRKIYKTSSILICRISISSWWLTSSAEMYQNHLTASNYKTPNADDLTLEAKHTPRSLTRHFSPSRQIAHGFVSSGNLNKQRNRRNIQVDFCLVNRYLYSLNALRCFYLYHLRCGG